MKKDNIQAKCTETLPKNTWNFGQIPTDKTKLFTSHGPNKAVKFIISIRCFVRIDNLNAFWFCGYGSTHYLPLRADIDFDDEDEEKYINYQFDRSLHLILDVISL